MSMLSGKRSPNRCVQDRPNPIVDRRYWPDSRAIRRKQGGHTAFILEMSARPVPVMTGNSSRVASPTAMGWPCATFLQSPRYWIVPNRSRRSDRLWRLGDVHRSLPDSVVNWKASRWTLSRSRAAAPVGVDGEGFDPCEKVQLLALELQQELPLISCQLIQSSLNTPISISAWTFTS